jgi:hypothetical protein
VQGLTGQRTDVEDVIGPDTFLTVKEGRIDDGRGQYSLTSTPLWRDRLWVAGYAHQLAEILEGIAAEGSTLACHANCSFGDERGTRYATDH